MFHRSPPVPTVEIAGLPGDAYLLDVREHDEWTAGHIDGAAHIPLGEIPARVAEVPDDRDVYVICRSGGRSAQATGFLLAQGRQASNVAGGMTAWDAAGRPMVGETAEEPYVA
jgi:rhodanese-related sulfurtransferase